MDLFRILTNFLHVHSQLCVNPDTSYFAVNAETEKIVGATYTELVGMDMKEIGLNTI